MPKFKFLEKDQKLTKANFVERLVALYNEASKKAPVDVSPMEHYYISQNAKNEYYRLVDFMDKSRKYLSNDHANQFAALFGTGTYSIRGRAFSRLAKYLEKNGTKTRETAELINELKKPNVIKNGNYQELANRAKNLVPADLKDEIKTSLIDYAHANEINKYYNEYIGYLFIDMNEQQMEEMGNEIINFIPPFEYKPEDDLTLQIYNEQTLDIINSLKANKLLDNKALNDDEIKGYEDALNFANKLYGKPKFNIYGMMYDKRNLDSAIAMEYRTNQDRKIKEIGYDPSVCEIVAPDEGQANYYVVKEGKEVAYKKNLEADMVYSNETKKGLKEIFAKMSEYGLDNEGLKDNKPLAFKQIKLLGQKYKEAITSEDPNKRMKAPIYAKELEDACKKVDDILNLIDKYLPTKGLDVAIPSNGDSIQDEDLPAKYRIDFIRTSHLNTIYALSNLIKAKNWNVDEFLNAPVKHIKEVYDNDLYNEINPTSFTANLKGNDLFLKLVNKNIADTADFIFNSGEGIVEGLGCLEIDKERRQRNILIDKIFEKNVISPYGYGKISRQTMVSDERMENIIINPNIEFKDLGIIHYDSKKASVENEEAPEYDEVAFIRKRTESIDAFKTRIDRMILSYMKYEAENAIKANSVAPLYIKTRDFINMVEKAVAKNLVIRREDKDNPSYQQLENFIRNKNGYVNSLINNIKPDNEHIEFMLVKELANRNIVLDGKNYLINDISDNNRYANILNTFDNFKTTQKALVIRQQNRFLQEEKTYNTQLKNTYNQYVNALKKYNTEVKRLYGANYNGAVDNLRDQRIKKAFVLKNELFRKLEEDKSSRIKYLEDKVKKGVIPRSYLDDRKMQLENNNYKSIPPLFRMDKMLTKDEFIKLSHPNDYKSMYEDDKNFLYDQYKNQVAKYENDYFSRVYLEENELSTEKDEYVDLGITDAEEPKLTEKEELIEAKLFGFVDLNTNKLEEDFAELNYLKEQNKDDFIFIPEFNRALLAQIKEYDDPLKKDSLPSFERFIDVAQLAAAKYLIVKEYEQDNPNVRELMDFISDGKNYVNNLVKQENERIDKANKEAVHQRATNLSQGPNPEQFVPEKKLNINPINEIRDEFNINKYTTIFSEFKNYQARNVTNSLTGDAYLKEHEINRKLLRQEAHINSLENDKNIMREGIKASEKPEELWDVEDYNAAEAEPNEFHINYDVEIAVQKEKLEELKVQAKSEINELFKQGLLTEEYVKNRFKKLDNDEFDYPNQFYFDDQEYINKKVKEETLGFDNLSAEEKQAATQSYKNKLIQDKNNFITKYFFIKKGYSKSAGIDSQAFIDLGRKLENESKLDDSNIIIDNKNKINIKEDDLDMSMDSNGDYIINTDSNRLPKQKIIIDNNLPQFNVGGINKMDEEDDLEDISYLKQYDNMEMEDLKLTHPYEVWAESLRNVIKDSIDQIKYEVCKIDEELKFDSSKDMMAYWLPKKKPIIAMALGNNTIPTLKKSIDNLDPFWKNEVIKEFASDINGPFIDEDIKELFGDYKFEYNKDNLDDSFKDRLKLDIDDEPSFDDSKLDDIIPLNNALEEDKKI